jgi:hypothetical protein
MSLQHEEEHTELYGNFCKMDQVFWAVGTSLRDCLDFPYFSTLQKNSAWLHGFRIDFNFEEQDFRARTWVCTENNVTDLVFSMPQPYDLKVPAPLQVQNSSAVSIKTLETFMPRISNFAKLLFLGEQPVVEVSMDEGRLNSGLVLVFKIPNAFDQVSRLVLKFGFKLR